MEEFEQSHVDFLLRSELERKKRIIQASLIMMAVGFFFYLLRGLVSYASRIYTYPWVIDYSSGLPLAKLITTNLFVVVASTLTGFGATLLATSFLFFGNPQQKGGKLLTTTGIIILAQTILHLTFKIVIVIGTTIIMGTTINLGDFTYGFFKFQYATFIINMLLKFIFIMIGLLVLTIVQKQERMNTFGGKELLLIVGIIFVLGMIFLWALVQTLYFTIAGTLHKTLITMVTFEMFCMVGMLIVTMGAIINTNSWRLLELQYSKG
ncbi:MAG: hypothetical protein K9W42_14140 [Candidatus Heimdallarchaeota archaeon]|nr:hypothetical protein [Candidatus Heimdallarchaeota archaeon]